MLVLAAIFASGAIVFSFFDGAIIAAVSPVWKAENVIIRSLRNGATYLSSWEALVEENTRLKEKVSSLEAEVLSLSGEKVQGNILLELVGRKQESNTVIAAVLTYPPQTPYDIIIIDAGRDDSVTLDSKVFLPEGSTLGRVSEVFSKKAKVKLFSSVGEETNAVLERNNVPVTLIGTGGGNFKLLLPRDIAVEKGDRILSTDITSRLVAIVGEVSVRSTDSLKEILAKSPINIFTLRFVFITP